MKLEHTINQSIKTGWRIIDGGKRRIRVTIRYDDSCKNGHNSFSITGETQRKASNGRWVEDTFGCIHDQIEKYYPEYKHLIKWHLVDSNAPMYYLQNTMYHLSDKDCYGYKKGEPCQFDKFIKFGDFPMSFKITKSFAAFLISTGQSGIEHLTIEKFEYTDRNGYKYSPKYTFNGFADEWHKCPFDSYEEAEQYLEALHLGFVVIDKPTAYSEGKERDLNAARSCAKWFDATDEELLSPDIEQRLKDRLPALMAEFYRDIETLETPE